MYNYCIAFAIEIKPFGKGIKMKEYISLIKNMKPKAIEVSSVVFVRFLLEKLNKLLFDLVAILWTTYTIRFIEIESNISGLIAVVCMFYVAAPIVNLLNHRSFERFTVNFIRGFIYSILTLLLTAEIKDTNAKEAESLFWFFLVWSIVYLIVKKAIPYAFNKYVNNKILDMNYLKYHIGENNESEGVSVFIDAKEEDAKKRFEIINKYAVKPDYQGIVELSFLKRESNSGLDYSYILKDKVERDFTDFNTIYHFVFDVFPLGIDIPDAFTLTSFSLSNQVISIASSLEVIELPVGIAKMKSKYEKKEDK